MTFKKIIKNLTSSKGAKYFPLRNFVHSTVVYSESLAFFELSVGCKFPLLLLQVLPRLSKVELLLNENLHIQLRPQQAYQFFDYRYCCCESQLLQLSPNQNATISRPFNFTICYLSNLELIELLLLIPSSIFSSCYCTDVQCKYCFLVDDISVTKSIKNYYVFAAAAEGKC